MDVGKQILTSIVNRVPRAAASYNGTPVTIFTNTFPEGDNPAQQTPELLWATQPNLRTVVDFICNNVAQLGLHAYTSDGEDRQRDKTSPLAKVIRRPNDYMTTFELVFDLVGNLSLHNRAYWFVYPSSDGRWMIQPFPAPWVTVEYDTLWAPKKYVVQPLTESQKKVEFSPEQVLAFEGWTPTPGATSSPVDTLRLVLEEQHHSRKHRVQLWRRNGRTGSYITRPQDAPEWTKTDRQRFYKMFESFVGDKGSRAGGVPLLEEGMEIKQTRFNSADEEWATSVTLALETVAQVYQVNPTMVGVLTNANYSNTKEFNKTLYTNTLGPTLRRIEQRLNTFLLPMIDVDPDENFLEFNVGEKLRGSFEEQAAVSASAVGAPYMTRNEIRKLNNMRALEGGDELVTPLNLATGGAAEDSEDTEYTSEDLLKRGNFASQLIRSGFDPAAALSTAGLPPVEHLGLLPVTVQKPQQEDSSVDTALVEEISGKSPEFDQVVAAHTQRVERVYAAKKTVDVDRFTRELHTDLTQAGLTVDESVAREINQNLAVMLEG